MTTGASLHVWSSVTPRCSRSVRMVNRCQVWIIHPLRHGAAKRSVSNPIASVTQPHLFWRHTAPFAGRVDGWAAARRRRTAGPPMARTSRVPRKAKTWGQPLVYSPLLGSVVGERTGRGSVAEASARVVWVTPGSCRRLHLSQYGEQGRLTQRLAQPSVGPEHFHDPGRVVLLAQERFDQSFGL